MDEVSDALRMLDHTGAEFPLLSDPDGETVRRYSVYNLLGDGVAAPATFIVGKDGNIMWSHIGKDIADRPSAIELLNRIHTNQS